MREVFPAQTRTHMQAAGREQLLAARSYLDHWIAKLDEKAAAAAAARTRRDHRRVTDQIGVIGAGAWGTTLAIKLAAAERPVTIWAHSPERNEELALARENRRYLPNVPFPPNIRVATEDAFLAEPHRAYLLAVPSAHLRDDAAAPGTEPGPECRAAERGEGDRGGQPLPHERGDRRRSCRGARVAVLSGPNLAREIAAGKPAGSVVASQDAELAARDGRPAGDGSVPRLHQPGRGGRGAVRRAEERRRAGRRHGRWARLRRLGEGRHHHPRAWPR